MRITKLALLGLCLSIPSVSIACDLCALKTAQNSPAGSFRFGVDEQFTSFGRIQKNGATIENIGSQHMESSISQLNARYSIMDNLSIQAAIPYINRRYRRLENEETQKGTEAGFGDLSAILNYTVLKIDEKDFNYRVHMFAGIKLPTGDSDQLKEEGHDDHEEELMHLHGGIDHGSEPEGAIHGHDLALGSGSVDFPIGITWFAKADRAMLYAELQYVFRTEGDHDYTYANDLLWQAGPGYLAYDGDGNELVLKANLSGEAKGKDSLAGADEGDTRIRSIFIGPEVEWSSANLVAGLAWDIPLEIDNSGTQAVADYKLRATLAYRF